MNNMETQKEIQIIDTTLRDGEQAPGVVFDPDDKIELACMLDDAGIDELETGTPAMGSTEQETMGRISALNLSCKMTAWCRAMRRDIEKAAACNTDGVHISFPVSDILIKSIGKTRKWVLTTLSDLIPYAKIYFNRVSVGAQDATRADMVFLSQFIQKSSLLRADRVRIADTVGIASPGRVMALIKHLRAIAPETALEFHGHNDLGMATANTISAIEAGVSCVSVTVNGLGERAGNARLEEVSAAVYFSISGKCRIQMKKLYGLCEKTAELSKNPISVDKPIFGKNAFRHESGIHCDALIRDVYAYQPFTPETIGSSPAEFVIGKHSGKSSLGLVLSRLGIHVTPNELEGLLKEVRHAATLKRNTLSSTDLLEIYEGSRHLIDQIFLSDKHVMCLSEMSA